MARQHYPFEFWIIPKMVMSDKRLTLTDKVVLGILVTMANGEKDEFKIKEKTIAEKVGAGERSIKRSVAKLQKLGLIKSEQVFKNLCNRYKIKVG